MNMWSVLGYTKFRSLITRVSSRIYACSLHWKLYGPRGAWIVARAAARPQFPTEVPHEALGTSRLMYKTT